MGAQFFGFRLGLAILTCFSQDAKELLFRSVVVMVKLCRSVFSMAWYFSGTGHMRTVRQSRI